MLHPELHKKPAALDAASHKAWRLREEPAPHTAARNMNVAFIAADEFGPVCKEYPLLFVRAGDSATGMPQVTPVAVLGMGSGENLFVPPEGVRRPRWRGRYVPRQLLLYPFGFAYPAPGQWSLCVDEGWSGWSRNEGEALFDEAGTPTPYLQKVHGAITAFEKSIEDTRRLTEHWLELGLLTEQVLTTRWPDSRETTIGGFLALDEQRLNNLSRMAISDLHRNGSLALLTCHQLSQSNWSRLVDRHWRRQRSGQNPQPPR